MRFELTDLRLFLHVVEAESITHGAERVGMALASASERIRDMELTSGVRLLDRNPCGVRPTAAGQAVVHHARVVLGQLEQMRGELGQYARGLRGHVRVLANTAAWPNSCPTPWPPSSRTIPRSTSIWKSGRAARSSLPSRAGSPTSASSPTRLTSAP